MNVLGILLIASLPAASPGDMRAEAEAAFQAGLEHLDDANKARPYFSRAARLYDELRQQGGDHPDLYLNQGNAYFLADDLPRAILSYRCGLRLAPSDPELRANLAHAREKVIYPQQGRYGRPAVENRPPWLPRWPGVLFLSALLLYAAACAAVTRWWMVREGPWLRVAGWLFVVALLPLAGFAWEEWQVRQEERYPIVVVSVDEVRLRKGNGQSYPAVVDAPLNRGVEARRLFQRGDWLQVELGSGEIGWLRSVDCVVDE